MYLSRPILLRFALPSDVGGLYQHKGYFHFDDFHLFVKAAHGAWQELPLTDPGFEDLHL